MPRILNTKITHQSSFLSKTCSWSSSHLEMYTNGILMYLPNVILQLFLSFCTTVNHNKKKTQFGDFLECSSSFKLTLTSFNEAFNQRGFSNVNGSKSDIYTPRSMKKGRTNQKSFWARNENTAYVLRLSLPKKKRARIVSLRFTESVQRRLRRSQLIV